MGGNPTRDQVHVTDGAPGKPTRDQVHVTDGAPGTRLVL
jgi:hypothetical protein